MIRYGNWYPELYKLIQFIYCSMDSNASYVHHKGDTFNLELELDTPVSASYPCVFKFGRIEMNDWYTLSVLSGMVVVRVDNCVHVTGTC